jgi:hypothetical protein
MLHPSVRIASNIRGSDALLHRYQLEKYSHDHRRAVALPLPFISFAYFLIPVAKKS